MSRHPPQKPDPVPDRLPSLILERREKHVLRNILGVFIATRDPSSQPEDERAMFTDETFPIGHWMAFDLWE